MATITLKEWLKIQCKEREKRIKAGGFDLRFPRVHCLDGESYSIQASENHYCYPDETLHDGEYTNVEVLTSEVEPDLAIFYHDIFPNNYNNVDVNTMQKLLDKHGGIKYDND